MSGGNRHLAAIGTTIGLPFGTTRNARKRAGASGVAPFVYWMPSISLSGMTFYTGNKLPKWKGDIFVGGQRTGEIPGTGRLERVLVNEKLEELRRESLLVPLEDAHPRRSPGPRRAPLRPG